MTNMSSPRRFIPAPGRLARQLALAVALASGTALLTMPGFADPAHAQRKKKDEKADPSKPSYSKEFVAAYNPVDTALKAPGADVAALKPQILGLAPLATSPDDQMALGGLMFNAGITGKDAPLQLQGLELMLASGKTKPEDLSKFNFVGYQINNQLQQYAAARSYLQKAMDLGYPAPMADLQLSMAELFFADDNHAEGLKYLADAIEGRKAQGEAVPENWYRRGVSVAYTNEIVPEVYQFVQGWVGDYPKPENWRDAVNLTRNLTEFEAPVMLDLLRLGRKVGTLNDANDYIIYVETADTRRLPKEVQEVIELAYASGKIAPGSDSYIDEQLKQAKSLIADDRAALPALERDAKAASAQLRTVVAAGDAFLSYNEYAKAAGFYERALTMPGVDRNLALTRLGIAQVGAGDTAAARETLAQVEGARAPIAMLWSAYAAQLSGGATTPAAPAAAN
ncbi:hypothetical protein [Erythrobacter donghaensis]|uniref:hypothetical protein n=1 Tax=Erythrobacter donghaensis TaxID=267135 RepID=UPI000A36AD51|nr:hypothetical protein [Erythrobacter donghaensis]